METSEKFVKQLTEEQRERLKEILKLHGLHDKRARAHSILLSDQRYSIDQIADIYRIDRQVVSDWLDSWDDRQFEGLGDDPKAYLIHEEGVSQRMPTMVIGDVAGTGYPDNPPPRSEPSILQSLPGGIIRDLPPESSSMDDQNIEQEPEPKARFISRIELGPASPELEQRARAFVNRLIN
jgi:Homeodomain-like domain-containing protein